MEILFTEVKIFYWCVILAMTCAMTFIECHINDVWNFYQSFVESSTPGL